MLWRALVVLALATLATLLTLESASVGVALAQLPATATDLVREPTIDYFRKPPVDPVALLRQQIDNGTATFTYEPEQGYLRSVMRALHLEADSQVLVYSKTSVQAVRINPKNPRGIYFGDAVDYTVDLPNQRTLRIVAPPNRRFPAGQQIYAAAHPDDCVVVRD